MNSKKRNWPWPHLKVAQNTNVRTSTGYRDASASEFRDSMGITLRGLGPTDPVNSTIRNFIKGEFQYMGIRHVRYTPVTNNGNHIQLARDLVATTVGTQKIKLLIEPGYLCNDPAFSHGCTGVRQSNSFRTLDFVINLFFGDPLLGPGIDILELVNEPNQVGPCSFFTTNNGPLTPGINGDFPQSECDPFWHDQYGFTWLQCLGEYAKKVWKYVQTDPRLAGVRTVSSTPTNHYLRDSQVGSAVDGADVYTQWGDFSVFCHYGADHPYCGFMLPGKVLGYNYDHEYNGGPSRGSATGFPNAEGFPGVVRGQGFHPERRGMITEFGYNSSGDPGVTEGWAALPSYEVFGNYWLRTHLEAFIRGHERFYYFNSLNEGDAIPRSLPAFGKPDDFTPYTWNGTGTMASVTNWNIRTVAVEMMHTVTQTVGDGDSPPNITYSIANPATDFRWLILNRDVPTPAHIMFVWRYTSFLKQPGVALDNHAASDSVGPSSVVTPAPTTTHINLPNATSVVEVHPIDQTPDTTLSFTGSGIGSSTVVGRGVDVTLREKPFMLVIT